MAREHTGTAPTNISGKGWKVIAFRLKDEIAKDQVGSIATGIALYGLFALFPAITAIVAVVAIAGLTAEPKRNANQISALRVMPRSGVIRVRRACFSERRTDLSSRVC